LAAEYDLVESCRGSFLKARGNVAVRVQSYLYASMAEPFLDDFGVNPLLEHQRRVSVPCRVEEIPVRPVRFARTIQA
jgi:hypothetical protein